MKKSSVKIICELDESEALEFLRQCMSEGATVSEKLEVLIQNFLASGDNHLPEDFSSGVQKKTDAVGFRAVSAR